MENGADALSDIPFKITSIKRNSYEEREKFDVSKLSGTIRDVIRESAKHVRYYRERPNVRDNILKVGEEQISYKNKRKKTLNLWAHLEVYQQMPGDNSMRLQTQHVFQRIALKELKSRKNYQRGLIA